MAAQQVPKTSIACQVAAREFSYTEEATAMFSEPATRSDFAMLQPADVGPITNKSGTQSSRSCTTSDTEQRGQIAAAVCTICA